MSTAGVVVIGGGQGGLQAAVSLRQEGYRHPVTIVSSEPGLPYQRPPLSKAYLKTGDAEKLAFRPEEFFADNDITLLSACHAESIDRVNRTVDLGGEALAYDHLILATGARNARPPIKGIEHTFGLRSLEDAAHLRQALASSPHVVVIGGGFIGLEFAAFARSAGHDVTIAEAGAHLMERTLSREMSELFRRKHEEMGTRLLLGSPVDEVSSDGVMLMMALISRRTLSC